MSGYDRNMKLAMKYVADAQKDIAKERTYIAEDKLDKAVTKLEDAREAEKRGDK